MASQPASLPAALAAHGITALPLYSPVRGPASRVASFRGRLATLAAAFTQAQLQIAEQKSRLYIGDYSDMPENEEDRPRNALFSLEPPPYLSVGEYAGYLQHINTLILALNGFLGTTRGLTTDKASRSRLALWGYWFVSRERSRRMVAAFRAAIAEDEEGGEGDEEMSEDAEEEERGDEEMSGDAEREEHGGEHDELTCFEEGDDEEDVEESEEE